MTVHHPLVHAAFWLACGAAIPAHAAEPRSAPAGPAAAGVAVPATRYQPVLPYRPAPLPAASPDRNWKALNRTVASYNSMSLTMDGMEEAAPPAPETAPHAVPAPAPAAPRRSEASQ
jgi:hypothetical protein